MTDKNLNCQNWHPNRMRKKKIQETHQNGGRLNNHIHSRNPVYQITENILIQHCSPPIHHKLKSLSHALQVSCVCRLEMILTS